VTAGQGPGHKCAAGNTGRPQYRYSHLTGICPVRLQPAG
jgi:hypothetical protein